MPLVVVQFNMLGEIQHDEVLRCVNHMDWASNFAKETHDKAVKADLMSEGAGTTMRTSEAWFGLSHVDVMPATVFPFKRSSGAMILGFVKPVRCYTCSVCGYVEMYAGEVTDPAKWGPVHTRQVK